MAFEDYAGIATVTGRIDYFIQKSLDAGVSAMKILPVAAVSVNESKSSFNMPNSNASLLPRKCFPVRQILALERGNTMLNANATLPQSWRAPEVYAELQNRGWLSNADQLKREFCRTDLPDNPNESLAYMFAWLLDNRHLEALRVFSIGATQMFLTYSPALGGSMQTRFPSLASLWEFYTATDTLSLWSSGAWDYLPHDGTPVEGITSCGQPTSMACAEGWLQRYQTGNLDWQQANWQQYARNFASNVRLVWSRLRALKAL
jgi:hypothetical protein